MTEEGKNKKRRVAPWTKLSINIDARLHEMFVAEAEKRRWAYRTMMEHILRGRYDSDDDGE